MGEGRKKGPGVGGAALNFKVVGNPQPANPKDNTIWLNTDVKITGHSFAAEQPEEMAEGEVWISTGVSSPANFNALKKNNITIYPLTAMQMIGGEMVKLEAKIWQNGEWHEWFTFLLKGGVDATDITGGWISYGATNIEYVVAPTVEFVDGFLHIYQIYIYGKRSGIGATVNKIDLTNAKTLYLKVESVSGDMAARVGAWTISGSSATLAAGKTDVTSACEVVVDVSGLSGSYHVGALIGRAGDRGDAHIYLSDIYWE